MWRLSEEAARALLDRQTRKAPKYGNRRTQVFGRWFDSAAEAERYLELLRYGQLGMLQNLELQPRFAIVQNGVKVGEYRADFAYDDLGTKSRVVEDVKGVRTKDYRLKKKLVEAQYGIRITEISRRRASTRAAWTAALAARLGAAGNGGEL